MYRYHDAPDGTKCHLAKILRERMTENSANYKNSAYAINLARSQMSCQCCLCIGYRVKGFLTRCPTLNPLKATSSSSIADWLDDPVEIDVVLAFSKTDDSDLGGLV